MAFLGPRFGALVILLGTALIAWPMHAAGLPIGAAVIIALVVLGTIFFLVEAGNGGPVGALTCYTFAGIGGIVAMVKTFPEVNSWVVGLGTLAVEVGAVVGLWYLAKVIGGKGGKSLRERVAAGRGWKYISRADVPVPGPMSVGYLQGVPNNAPSTTGTDVVYANANGLNVTVFDRMRPNEKNAKVQTVWLVHLPLSLPFLSSGYASFLKGETPFGVFDGFVSPGEHPLAQQGNNPAAWTADEHYARALLTPPALADTDALSFPYWIENNYLCAAENTGKRTGSAARVVEHRVDALTAFAARLPWPQLAEHRNR
jgi:hypothetical protein